MTTKKPTPKSASSVDAAGVFAAATEAAIAGLEGDVSEGMEALERALAARIRHAISDLSQCVQELSGDSLMVPGSTGQMRPHPLLKTLQDLRREIAEGLKDLSFRVSQGAFIAEAQTIFYANRRQPAAAAHENAIAPRTKPRATATRQTAKLKEQS